MNTLTPTMQTIEDLRIKAEKAGFRMSEVCRHANLDPAQVSRWATGKTIPLITSVRKLEESLDQLIEARLEAIKGVL